METDEIPIFQDPGTKWQMMVKIFPQMFSPLFLKNQKACPKEAHTPERERNELMRQLFLQCRKTKSKATPFANHDRRR